MLSHNGYPGYHADSSRRRYGMRAAAGPLRIWSRRTLLLVLPLLVLAAVATRLPVANGQVPSGTPSPVPSNGPAGPIVRLTYPPGWNLVAAPAGAALPPSQRGVLTYPAGATAYQSVDGSSTQPGTGYWEY